MSRRRTIECSRWTTRAASAGRRRPRERSAPVPTTPPSLRTALEAAGWKLTPQRLAVYEALRSCRGPSDGRGSLPPGPPDDPHDQPRDGLQGPRGLLRRRPGRQAVGRGRHGPLRRPPRTPLPLPLSPLGHGRGPADRLRPRPDRQARPRAGRPPGPPGVPGHGLPARAGRLLRGRWRHRGVMTPPALVDTHAHLDHDRLRPDIDAVLSRARAEGVVQVVAIATTAADSASVLDLAGRHRGVFAAVGIHPNDAAEAGPDDWAKIVAAGRPAPRRRPGRDRARPPLGPYAVRRPAGLLRPPPRARPRAGPARGHPLPRGRG